MDFQNALVSLLVFFSLPVLLMFLVVRSSYLIIIWYLLLFNRPFTAPAQKKNTQSSLPVRSLLFFSSFFILRIYLPIRRAELCWEFPVVHSFQFFIIRFGSKIRKTYWIIFTRVLCNEEPEEEPKKKKQSGKKWIN